MNIVVLRGRLSTAPRSRSLPSGAVLGSFEVTVRPRVGAAETVPVVWFDPPSRALQFAPGADVVVAGRVRRRFFRSGTATASRTEVVAHQIVPAAQRVRVLGLLDVVVAALEVPEEAAPRVG